MARKLPIERIFGGRSGEHGISARAVMSAIDKTRYEVVPIGITKEGRWLASGDPMKALASGLASESNPALLLAEPSERGLMHLSAGVRLPTSGHVGSADTQTGSSHDWGDCPESSKAQR